MIKNHILSTLSLRAMGLFGLVTLVTACATYDKSSEKPALPNPDPFPSTYKAKAHQPWAVVGATILTGTGEKLDNATLLVEGGQIRYVGPEQKLPENTRIVEGAGKWVTPGLIDAHSHMGVYAAPATHNHRDGNEMTSPVTGDVWAEHSIWPQDPQFELALAGGVTSLQVLPGSGNLIGGRGITLKNVPSLSVQGMKYPDAPYSLKMACGENPKRVYGSRQQKPSTRMGNMAVFRAAWIDAQEYQKEWKQYEEKINAGDKDAKRPKRDLNLETLAGVLDGQIRIHNHCYRADEMMQMIDMSKEFGFKISTFHHAVEAYKIAPVLAKEGICSAMWADWWGFKQEAFDMVEENIALVDYARACALIHSDSGIGIQYLNQEIAKAMTAGNRLGMNIRREHAIVWATLNPARALGIEEQTGSLEQGKQADVVLWNSDPFSIYSRAEKVWIDGVQYYDREHVKQGHTSDFNIGILKPEENRP